MVYKTELSLMSHLMRRAGFGANRHELEHRVQIGYEETAEDLINVDRFPPVDEHLLYRYHPISEMPGGIAD